ncbi:MAG: DNA polymerase III subunit delta [Pyrinomonadaceae bacterium]|nr:DNA polymerase III subunit delta [Pyrinomonadaceae bacterium]
MPLTREQLREQLRRREIAPVYVLYGAETYLRDIAAKTISELSFGKDDFRDFNDDVFSLNTPDNIKNALAAADQLPMMAQRRVVKITEVRVTASANKDSLKEDQFDAIAAYLANPSPNSVVIFVADELNRSRKVGKLLSEKSVSVEFTPLGDAELVKWANSKLDEFGTQMDDRTLRHLIAMIGPDVRRLTIEIGKLSTAALPDKVINIDLVDSLVANVREIPNFDLTDNLVAGNKAKALKILSKILNDGAEPLMLLGLLSYNYRRLLMVKDMMERGVDRSEVSRVMKLRYNDQEAFLAAARRASLDQLKKAVVALAETDLAIKTSIGGPGPKGSRLQLEMLVCKLAA